MRRIGLFSGIVAGALVLASPALAGWGEDWGTMVWGAEPTAVPTLGLLGLTLLAMGLTATAAYSLRKRRPALGLSLTLVLLAIPLAVAAGTVAVPNTFSNGTTADADEVNANFDAVETAVNDNDSRITAVDNDAAAAQSTANTAVTDAAAAQATADAAQITAGWALNDAADAQGAADTAATDAAAAQSTADGAVTNAATAQGTANTALVNAAAAQSTADSGTTNFIQNQTAVSQSASFRISGDGEIDGELDVANDITFGAENTSLTTALASAGGGVGEINQDCAENTGCFSGDAAGFPVTITGAAGRSYRLTSDLTVPNENTDGIVVSANDIGIDLNNFAIIGPVTCSGTPVSCSHGSGTGSGVERVSSSNYGTSVKNGSISGMGNYGVYLGRQAEVTNLRVRWNRLRGIYASYGSTVSGNTAYNNGYGGIYAWDGSTVSGNTVYTNGGDGIFAHSGSTVSGNTVRGNTGYGLKFFGSHIGYSENVISGNTAGTVNGSGVQFGQNVCDGNTTCP